MAYVEVVNPENRRRGRRGRKRRSGYRARVASNMRRGYSMKEAHRRARRGLKENPRRGKRRKRRGRKKRANTWPDSSRRHAKAARKGWQRRRRRGRRKRRTAVENPRRRRGYRRRYAANPRRRRRHARENPLKLRKYFRTGQKITLGDVGGAAWGFAQGTGISGLTKVASGNDAAGVLANGVSYVLTPMGLKYFKLLKPTTRSHVLRGWMWGGGAGLAVDGVCSALNYFLKKTTPAVSMADLEAMSISDKVKTVFLKGMGNPDVTLSGVIDRSGGELAGTMNPTKPWLMNNKYIDTDGLSDADVSAEEMKLAALKEYVASLKGTPATHAMKDGDLV